MKQYTRRIGMTPPKVNPKQNPLARLIAEPEQMVLLCRCAARARQLTQAWRALSISNGKDTVLEPNDQITQIDYAVAWLQRDYDFRAALQATDLAFMADFTSIEQNIQRERFFLSRDVMLRFARNGSRIPG